MAPSGDDNGSATETGRGTTLLLIDVQRDFHPGGSLAIPTANEDATRIAQLIINNGHKIDRIIATLDSHHKLHIAHPSFWYSGKLHPPMRHPEPFTIITKKDIEAGKWVPRSNLKLPFNEDFLDADIFSGLDRVVNEDNEFDLKLFCIEYTRQLEARGRFKLCIWPEHCLMGHLGHCIVDQVRDAMDDWAENTGGSIEWIFKGQSLLTEAYSALQAEVPLCTSTDFDQDLMDDLLFCDRLLVGGQAKSHCVNYTLRDIVDKWPPGATDKISLLTDCTSAVPGFEKHADAFEEDMKRAGVTLAKSSEVFR